MIEQEPSTALVAPRRFQVRKYNQRMAQRIARRAKLDENAVAVAFTYNNLVTMCIFSGIEGTLKFVPAVGELAAAAVSLVSFWFHRIVIVTDKNVYVYRDLPFHYPHKRVAAFTRGSGVVKIGSPNPSAGGFSRFIRRGQLTFQDGHVAYHSVIWIKRAQYVEQEANIPAGQ